MAIFYNPSIITENLVLCLDAGNSKSYPGSGTTWTDIIGRGNTGTLTNSPTYSSQNGGFIVFNGVNNYVENLSPNLGISGDTSVTLSCWFFNSVNSSNNQALLVYGNGSTGGDSISILLRNLSFYASFNGGLDAVIADNVYALNTWNNVVVTKTPGAINTTTKLYLNGIEQTITSASSSTPSLSSRVVRVARWTDDTSPYYFLGGVSAALIYNRALSAAEVLHNYNSLKNRFVTAPVLIPSEYQISRSLRFNSADSAYLNRTPSVAGNRKTWTWAGWVKRCVTTNHILFNAGTTSSQFTGIQFTSTGQIEVFDYTSSYNFRVTTTAVYRDLSAWMHFVVAFDATNATTSNRVRIYVNGSEVTTFAFASYPANVDWSINSTSAHNIGRSAFNGAELANMYLADVHFIDGQALTPSSFTEINGNTGQLVPKDYSGTYGTNGWKLNFSDNSATTTATLGADSSGNGNNWTPNNLSVTAGAGNDSLTDTPTSYGTDTGAGGEVRGNYATLNPTNTGASNISFSNGNLDFTGGGIGRGVSTISMVPGSGKFYCEFTCTSTAQFNHPGIYADSISLTTDANRIVYRQDGNVYTDGAFTQTITSFTNGNIIGMTFNADTRQLTYYKNGSLVGGPYQASTPPNGGGYYFHILSGSNSGCSGTFNFGQRPFAYAAPTGFKCLCDTNLPAPTIAKGSSVFDITLYTGNSSTQTISTLNFSPDLIWGKARNIGYFNTVQDTVRGAGLKVFYTNSTDAENASSQNWINSFDSNGFSMLSGVYNESARTYAAWCWDAGSSTVTNTAGSISSQARANTSSGFSVVTYTGTGANATVGHGLGVAPSMVIVKRRDTTGNWQVRHTSIAAANSIQLNATTASAAATTVWNSTAPSSTVFSIGTSTDVNASAGTYVAYCFAPVTGYSSFGSYTGNGSTDGTFVYTGFRPRWILVKRTDGVIQWTILDTARSPVNVADQRLFPNLSQGETVNGDGNTDLLSNGFKLRNIDSAFNTNGATYIYAAFAENPFQFSRAR
jgi:hypothetical protein